jgi:hypothetical protein
VSRTPDFAFLTNYGKALLVIATDPQVRMRDIATLLQITERAAQRIVAELTKAGYINRERDGRRNRYSVMNHMPVGLPIQRDIDIESLLAILNSAGNHPPSALAAPSELGHLG